MAPLLHALPIARGILASRAFGTRRPLLVGAALTRRCDGSCLYCGRAGTRGEELPTSAWIDLLDGMAQAGTARVSFTGGEPLLRPDVGRLLWEARRRGLFVNLNTNGFRLAERLDEVVQADSITVSFDGPEAMMDQLRGPGAYRRAVDGIRSARAAGVPVSIHATLTRINVGQVDAIVDEAKRLGVGLSVAPLRSVPLGPQGDPALFPAAADLHRAMDALIGRKRRGDRTVQNSSPCLRHLQHWPAPRRLRCAAGRIYVRLEPDGRLFACGEEVTSPAHQPAAKLGFAQAFRQLRPSGCDECWCDNRVETNLIYGLHPTAAWSVWRR